MASLGNKRVKSITEIWAARITCINKSLKKAMATHQEIWEYGLSLWQVHNQYLLNNWLGIVTPFYTQSLTSREHMGELFESYLRSLQMVTITKDEKFFETAETLQAGVRTNSERVAKLFAP